MVAHKMLATPLELKANDSGEFTATIATLGVVDRDQDVTFPGAFPTGKSIPISSYGHGSWKGSLPVGKAILNADSTHAWVDGRFFTNTAAGADTYHTVKGLGGLAQWSYGYDVLQGITSTDPRMAAYPSARRGLVSVNVHEVSPVLVGAGVGTATTAIKSAFAAIADEPRAFTEQEQIGLAYAQRSAQLAQIKAAQESRPQVEDFAVRERLVHPGIRARAYHERDRAARDLRIAPPTLHFFSAEGGQELAGNYPGMSDLRGCAEPGKGLIWVREDLVAAGVTRTVAHEVGHVAGMGEEDAERYADRAYRAAVNAELRAYYGR